MTRLHPLFLVQVAVSLALFLLIAATASAIITIKRMPCINIAGAGEKKVRAFPRNTRASMAARTAICINTPPSKLLPASSAAPFSEAATVVAISGRLVAPPSNRAPAKALPTPVRSAKIST